MEFISRVRPAIITIILVIAVDILWLMSVPHSFAEDTAARLAWTLLMSGLFGIAAYLVRETTRLSIFCAGISILLLAWPALRIFNHLSLTVPLELADDRLMRADRFFGFDWLSYVAFIDSRPLVIKLMNWTYFSLTYYTAILFIFLLATRDAVRSCSELIVLFIITAVLCSAIGALLPAVGPMHFISPPLGTFTHFGPDIGTYSVPGIMERRNGLPQTFDLANLPGLTTFPSFHTAMGIIAIYCARRSIWLFAPMLAVNAIMIAGTPIFGAHYLVDLIAGGGTVALAIMMLKAIKQFRNGSEIKKICTVNSQPISETNAA